MIQRRLVLALTAIVGVIILVLAYSGIESSRENMLKLIAQEGESMMQALVTSAGNNLSASTIVEEISSSRLAEIAELMGQILDGYPRPADSLGVWERRYQCSQISVVNNEREIVASSWPEAAGTAIADSSLQAVVVDSVLSGDRHFAIAAPLPSALPRDDEVYVAVRVKAGALLITAPARKLYDYQESLGIGFVVRKMGGQKAIDYVVLQNDSGIVLASRDIGRMMAIQADPFLAGAMEHEEILHRLYEFEDQEVLEVVRSFKSDVMPSGLLRIGMALDAYHELYADSLKQLAILSAVLFALGVVGAYAATSLKRLQVTTGSLEQLRSLTDEIVQSLEAAVVAVNEQGRITVFNPQAEKLFGKTAKALTGQAYSDAFPDDALVLTRISTDVTQRFRGELQFQQSQGDQRQLLVSSTPIVSAEGRYSGAVALAYDLTELKKLEENARAAERLSELGTLAAGVAHEIRNPLNTIAIATQRLRLEFRPTENQAEYSGFLKTIGEEIDRLNSIIKDFLSLARGQRLGKVLVDLRDFVNEIVALARLEAEKRGIEIRTEIAPGLKASIDQSEMKKVFHNLIQNALQSFRGAGDITIRGKRADANRAQIEISNSGEPIVPEVRARIFQPYFTTRADGTGLGLAICRRIVADHGGTIELLEGEPTTFRIVV